MDLSQIVVTDEWADWPTPSPTSAFNINVRFYSVVNDDDASVLRLDIGAENERLLESLYHGLHLADRLPPMAPTDFEKYIRDIYQTRIDNLLPYTLLLSQYAVLTTDAKEVRRSLNAEQRTMTRALRLLPHRIIPTLVDPPTGWRDRLRKEASYLLTQLRLMWL